jgi:aminoglycoside/choline kinase family phosphotransferase
MENTDIKLARFDKDYLTSWVELFVKEPVSQIECMLLKGDASDRNYYRAKYVLKSSPEMPRSVIIMQLAKLKAEPDFNSMQKFLRNLDIPVPDIFHFDAKHGLLFLMDCGDTHLGDKITEEPKKTVFWYQKAIDIIVTFHIRATDTITPDSPAHSLFFDEEKLLWEMDFMLEHYVQGMLMCASTKDQTNKVRESFRTLCKTLSKEDRVFTHRDYHSRNIMIHNGKLKVIDFQDARMGPCQYDLVSLLKDSYVVLNESVRSELLEYYIECMEQNGREVIREPFYKIFEWMSLQRNLKAIGTFAYQHKVLGNDRYLQYIEPTLDYLRQTLGNRRDLEFLSPALNSVIPTLNAN